MAMTENWYVDCDECRDSIREIGSQDEVRDMARDNGWFVEMEEGIAYCPKCRKKEDVKKKIKDLEKELKERYA